MEVFVTTHEHGKLRLRVDPESSVAELKKELQRLTAIHVHCQILYHNGNDISNLRNTLRKLEIPPGAEFMLHSNNKVKISVKTPKHGKHRLTLSYEMEISELQEELEILTGIPIPFQILYHKRTNVASCGKTLRELGIRPHDLLMLWDRQDSHRILVATPQTEPISLDVHPPMTILQIQESLELMTGIPVESQIFSRNGVDLSISTQTVSQLRIVPDDRFDLYDNSDLIRISIKTPHHVTKMMDVQRDLDFRGFQNQLETMTGIPVAHQILSYQDNNLSLSNQTFRQLGIRPRAEFVLQNKCELIIIKIRMENGDVGNYPLIQLQTIKMLIMAYLRQQNPRPVNVVTFVCRPNADGSPVKYENAIDVNTTFADLLIKNGDMLCVGTISKDKINPAMQ